MYEHCPTCTARLGTNRVLESFPVGRRLAFDARRGRLWVLCPRCRSWSLSPLEERWEAVDEAARLFEGAVVGASTRTIALGRVADGTELLRVGGADRAELAGWRYGRELVGRWRRHRGVTAASLGAGAALLLVPAVGAGAVATLYLGLGAGGLLLRRVRSGRPVFRREPGAEGPEPEDFGTPAEPIGTRPVLFRERDVQRLLLVPGRGEPGWRVALDRWYRPPLELDRREALRALRAMLAVWNAAGGHPRRVLRATERVLHLGSADAVLARAARDLNRRDAWEYHLAWPFRETARIQWADPTLRLALEMAAHDELERRALAGELRLLEREWREAEALARIADALPAAGRAGGRGREGRDGSRGHGDAPDRPADS